MIKNYSHVVLRNCPFIVSLMMCLIFHISTIVADTHSGNLYDKTELRARCKEFTEQIQRELLPNETTVIISTQFISTVSGNTGSVTIVPAYCRIHGKLNERIGLNLQYYSINFLLHLPIEWNGRFFFAGGASTNGNLISPSLLISQLDHRALEQGYAVVTQDSGHNNTINNNPLLNGKHAFGFDPLARRDFGYHSYAEVTYLAKTLIRLFYGKPPEKSYYVGCSEGGREGMMMSQRFPNYYDGIIATAPGFRLPLAALVGAAWDAQAFASLAQAQGHFDKDGNPHLNKTFSDEDLSLVSKAVIAGCDMLDGLNDGLIDNFPKCTTDTVLPELKRVECSNKKHDSCLSGLQIKTLVTVMNGARNSAGELLYADWPWDAGFGGAGITQRNCPMCWRSWKIGWHDSVMNDATSLTLGAMSAAAIFTTPPTPLRTFGGDAINYLLAFNFDTDVNKIYATRPNLPFFSDMPSYVESAWEFMMASSTDLSGFKKRHGKLIIIHGVSDPIFSINDIINWWEKLNTVNDGKAAEFARLFAIPGMGHCFGGPATDDYDVLTALENWVEKDIVPEKIIATARQSTPWPGRTRPLCVYPKQARYTGEGDIEKAENFECL